MALLAGRVVTITGAASGMGNAFARIAASRGAKLALADVQQQKLEELTSELQSKGTEVTSTVVDVSVQPQVDDWIDSIIKRHGKLDCSANMAGILGQEAPLTDTTNEVFDRILGVNLYGTINCVRAQLKVMQKGASIVNVASIAGMSGVVGRSAYCVSKHGVIGLTRTVAKEVAVQGIRSTPSLRAIDTPMIQEAGGGAEAMAQALPEQIAQYVSPMMRLGRPDEVADLVAFLLSDESTYISGSIHVIDGALTS